MWSMTGLFRGQGEDECVGCWGLWWRMGTRPDSAGAIHQAWELQEKASPEDCDQRPRWEVPERGLVMYFRGSCWLRVESGARGAGPHTLPKLVRWHPPTALAHSGRPGYHKPQPLASSTFCHSLLAQEWTPEPTMELCSLTSGSGHVRG